MEQVKNCQPVRTLIPGHECFIRFQISQFVKPLIGEQRTNKRSITEMYVIDHDIQVGIYFINKAKVVNTNLQII